MRLGSVQERPVPFGLDVYCNFSYLEDLSKSFGHSKELERLLNLCLWTTFGKVSQG